MPPTRRGRPSGSTSSHNTGNNNPRAAQSTLAFGRSNKITKPSVPPPASKKGTKLDVLQQQQPEVKDIKHVVDEQAPTKEVEDAIETKTEVVTEDPALAEGRREADAARAVRQRQGGEQDDDAEEKARKVSEAAVKRYWRAKEGERKAPRVHQQQLSLHEKILRHFDLSSQYGPCVGIPRVRRWKRAQGLGLQPPIEVLAVLVKERE
ncbi:MAG: hypothetical protein Q9210_005440, partial [Variospora velana]